MEVGFTQFEQASYKLVASGRAAYLTRISLFSLAKKTFSNAEVESTQGKVDNYKLVNSSQVASG